jgi:response regulator RpfG family c-di-GMP phosphodiesterase
MLKPRILCVDDEKVVLDSLKKELNKSFKDMLGVEIAESADEALELIRELLKNNYEIPIVICDWLMPGMKGDELLFEVHKILPNTRKILLTGQATSEGVGNAVNKAKLYAYIAKPWQFEDFELTITEAFKSYYFEKQIQIQQNKILELNKSLELKVHERTKELIESRNDLQKLLNLTLQGSIYLLIDIFTKSFPEIFEKSIRMRNLARRIMKKEKIPNSWEVEIACLLSQIGCLELSHDILEKYKNNEPLNQKERKYFNSHPQRAYALLKKIPFLENIAFSIAEHLDDVKPNNDISVILRLTSDFDTLLVAKNPMEEIISTMRKNQNLYNKKFLDALLETYDEFGQVEEDYMEEPEKASKENKPDVRSIHINELAVGDCLAESITNIHKDVLLPSGKEITKEILFKLKQLSEDDIINEPIIILNKK